MYVHTVQHVDFEGPGLIAEWLARRAPKATTALALTEEYPEPSTVDLAVLLGGPMSADDEAHHPWLRAEKRFAYDVLDAGGRVLGVCLGAQVLVEVLGGRVRRNAEREIGWFALDRKPGSAPSVLDALPDGIVVGHWHGDTFDLPQDARGMHATAATASQDFVGAGGRALGLQFHLEWEPVVLGRLVERCGDELVPGPHVQPAEELLAGTAEFGGRCRAALFELLDRFCEIGRNEGDA